MKDLVILASCQNCKAAVKGIVDNFQKLGTRAVQADVFVHAEHDSGCVKNAVSILRSQQNLYRFALVACDHEGSGSESRLAVDLETAIELQLSSAGWANRAAAVVIEPELESWVWSDSPHVATTLGWQLLTPSFREWLETHEWLLPGQAKPLRPKEAVEAVMAYCRKQRTSAIYTKLAHKVSFGRCQDRAFLKLCHTLRAWFPAAPDIA